MHLSQLPVVSGIILEVAIAVIFAIVLAAAITIALAVAIAVHCCLVVRRASIEIRLLYHFTFVLLDGTEIWALNVRRRPHHSWQPGMPDIGTASSEFIVNFKVVAFSKVEEFEVGAALRMAYTPFSVRP